MADVPDVITYGRVVGRFVSFLADSDDPDEIPDEIPLTGMVTLTPDVGYMRLPGVTPSRVASIQSASCPIINGDVYPPDTTIENLPATPGVVVMATEQPAGEPNRVNWTASISLSGGASMGTIAIDVPSNGIVDLATIVPAAPQPGIIKVVSSEDRIGAELAAAEAAASADEASLLPVAQDAAQSATEAAASESAAAQSAAEAASSESSAAQSATDAAASATEAALLPVAQAAEASATSAAASESAAAESASTAAASEASAAQSTIDADQARTSAEEAKAGVDTSVAHLQDTMYPQMVEAAGDAAQSAADAAGSATDAATARDDAQTALADLLASMGDPNHDFVADFNNALTG